uniref:Cytochrome P450 n=1 Tax=Glossina pallidipes TaxID=7398 RepID=A0A1B0AFQ8_GLOPL
MLATNPEKQLRLREEICELLPEPWSPLTTENSKNMPYLRACLKESLRIMPITPGNMRTTIKDLVLSGYQIPAGSNVLMGVMPLANTDEYFPKSDKFLPERWLKNEKSAELKSKNAFVYAPFGMGPRTCIGKRIAEMEIETLITRLIRNYHISWSVNELIAITDFAFHWGSDTSLLSYVISFKCFCNDGNLMSDVPMLKMFSSTGEGLAQSQDHHRHRKAY